MTTPERFVQRGINRTENDVIQEETPRRSGSGSNGDVESRAETVEKRDKPATLEGKLNARDELADELSEVRKNIENVKATISQTELSEAIGASGKTIDIKKARSILKALEKKEEVIKGNIGKISDQEDVKAWEKAQEKEKKDTEYAIKIAGEKLLPRVREIINEIIEIAERKFKLQREASAQNREYGKAWADTREAISGFENLKNPKSGAEIIKFLEREKENAGILEFGKKSLIEKLLSKKGQFELLDEKTRSLKEIMLRIDIVNVNIEDIGKKYKTLLDDAFSLESEKLKESAKKLNMSANFRAGVIEELKRATEPLMAVRVSTGGEMVDPEKESLRDVVKKVRDIGEQ